jgi:hypothetical protein
MAFWNAQAAILKERNFGLSNTHGNHGEDVKEYLNAGFPAYARCAVSSYDFKATLSVGIAPSRSGILNTPLSAGNLIFLKLVRHYPD